MSYRILKKGSGFASLLSSTFEAEILPLDDASAFPSLYSSFRLTHPKADHYPYAYRAGELAKSSDDGEPGGTAGKGMLSMMEEKGIQNAAIVVARYFGGTKLGTGRLHRCFLSASKEALENAVLGLEIPFRCLSLDLSYSRYEEVKRLCSKKGYDLCEEEYGLSVKTKLYVDGRICFRDEELFLTQGEILSQKEVIRVKEVHHDPCQ